MNLWIGRRYSRLERGPVTTTGRCAEHKKCGSFHVAENRHPGWGGLRDRLRVVYYHFRGAGTFPTPFAVLCEHMAVQASENLVLRHEREMERRQGGGTQATRGWMLSRAGDFSRDGDGEVGGNDRKRKSGLIMRVSVRVERLTEMFKLA